MNKGKTTEGRLKWTTLALNHFMDVQHDLDGLRISKKDQQVQFVQDTQKEADKITAVIVQKVYLTIITKTY